MILLAIWRKGEGYAFLSSEHTDAAEAVDMLGMLLRNTHRPEGYQLSPSGAEQLAQDLIRLAPASITLDSGDRLTIDKEA